MLSPEFVERYQKIYEKNPKSKVFAPLAEAYRTMGMIDEGLDICENGVLTHPNFPGGRVVLAKLLIDSDRLKEAVDHLHKAIDLSPENLLAHSLLSESLLRLKRPKEALDAFKMTLFLNPSDKRAQKAVHKLESLTAYEYEEDAYSMKPLSEINEFSKKEAPSSESKNVAVDPTPEKGLERHLSLVDALIARNDIEKADDALQETERIFGLTGEILQRKQMLFGSLGSDTSTKESFPSKNQESPLNRRKAKKHAINKKIKYLKFLLALIHENSG